MYPPGDWWMDWNKELVLLCSCWYMEYEEEEETSKFLVDICAVPR